MQEAKDQSQFRINPPLITVQDIEKKLKCPHGNPAFSLCTNSECQKPNGIMCRTHDCTCSKLHPKCSFVQLQGILTDLCKDHRDMPQENRKSFKVARQTINAISQQLSGVKDRLQRQQQHFGLQECKITFMKLVEEQNFEKFCGKFTSELVKRLQCKKQLFMRSNKHIRQEFQETKAKFDSLCEYIQNHIMKLVPGPYNIKITPDKQSRSLRKKVWQIDDTNSNVCIVNSDYSHQWLYSCALPFDGELVFTIKVIKLTSKDIWIGVMQEDKKQVSWIGDTWVYNVSLNPFSQWISIPNEEQTSYQWANCSCSKQLPQCPFQIKCHVNQQQSTIAWHYDGKQQAKSTLPKAWKTNQKPLCVIVNFTKKGDSLEMM